MPDNLTFFSKEETEGLHKIIPPILMAFGAVSLLRSSRLLSLTLIGVGLYDLAKNSDASRQQRSGNALTKRAAYREVDSESEDSFPASDPPSYSGTTAGAP
jgi:hypothetical protein